MPPNREIVCADALAWLDEHPAAEGTAVVTSLPDVSELPALGFEAWRGWFVATARRVIRWVPPTGVALFFQSDVRHAGTWVDKGHLVTSAADAESALMLWHTVVCRRPAGTMVAGRASWSHLLCFAHRRPARSPRPRPDVLPAAGFMPWSKAMGVEACELALRFLIEETDTRLIVDPFCGHGTVLAVANRCGLDAIGIDISRKCCRAARRLTLPDGR